MKGGSVKKARSKPVRYLRNGIECFLDPCRGYLVAATPEECVRQETIQWLQTSLKIPLSNIRSEYDHLSDGGRGRSDILVRASADEGEGQALLVVECKKPGFYLEEKVRQQAIGYANQVGARFGILTNGDVRLALARKGSSWREIDRCLTWRQMLTGSKIPWSSPEVYSRFPFEMYAERHPLKKLIEEYDLGCWVGEDSTWIVQQFALNILGLLVHDSSGPSLPLSDDRITIVDDLNLHGPWPWP
jgi:Type I restriction enzyme R protein N terminus (HSDR_N)